MEVKRENSALSINKQGKNLISVLNEQLLNTVKSPEMSSVNDTDIVWSKKPSPFRRNLDTKPRSPRIINHSDDNSILPLLGPKNIISNNLMETLSPCYSQRNILTSPKSVSEQPDYFDYRKFYNPNRNENTYDEQSDIKNYINRLESRFEEQSRMNEILLEKLQLQNETPRKNTNSNSRADSVSRANFTIPSSEPVKMSRIPNYESMNDDEIAKFEARFRNNFQELTNSYPKWNIEVPKIGQISLRVVHEIYEEVVNTIVTYQNAMKYKVGIAVLFAAIEYYGNHVYKIKALKNFCKVQIKTIHKYDSYLLSFSKSMNTGEGGDEWPTWLKALVSMGTSALTFVSLSAFANSKGWTCPEMILTEADKFVSPSDGPAKLKDDGISEVPVPPTGLQDPNEILRQGVGLIDFVNGVTNPQVAPVDAKPIPKSNYDDVYC